MKNRWKVNLMMSLFLTLVLLFSGSINVQAAIKDDAPPSIKNIFINKNEARFGDNLIVTVEAVDNSAGLADEANLCYVSKMGDIEIEKGIRLKLINGKYVGEIKIDDTFVIGNWKIDFIAVEDKEKNVSVVYNSHIHSLLTDFSADIMDLSRGNFEVIPMVGDITGPRFNSVSISHNEVGMYDNITISVDASDDLSGLADEADLCYISKLGNTISAKEVPLKLINGKYTGKINIDETYGIGSWKVSFIVMQDKEQNVTIAYNSDIHNGIGSSLKDADFRINEDISAPEFQGIYVNEAEVELYDNLVITVEASDENGLADEANICYVLDSHDVVMEKEIPLKLKDGKYTAVITIDEEMAAGTWKPSFITMQDKKSNVKVIYNSDVHEGLGRSLKSGDINVVEDILAPAFRGISVLEDEAEGFFKITVDAYDASSELGEEANICYSAVLNGELLEKEIPLKLKNNKYTGIFESDGVSGIGLWKVNFIVLDDSEHNARIIYNSDVHYGIGQDLSEANIVIESDTVAPKLESIFVNENDVELYDNVTVVLKASDESGLYEEANLCYILENEDSVIEKEIPLTLKDGLYQADLNIDESFKRGTWKISFITLQDKEKNVRVIYNSDVHEDLGEDLTHANISIDEDIILPKFEGIEAVYDEIEDYYTVKVKASDESGLAQEANVCYIHEEYDGLHEQEIPLTLKDGEYVGKIQSLEAAWDVNFITLEDKAGNVRVVYNSDVHQGIGEDLSSGRIVSNDDVVGPWLVRLGINDTEAELYDNIDILVAAFDLDSKLAEEANMCLVSEQNGKVIEKEIPLILTQEESVDDFTSAGYYEAKFNIDESFGIGTWKVSFITLEDVNNNVRIYYNPDIHNGFRNYYNSDIYEDLGEVLSDAQFTINEDIVGPSLEELSVTSNEAVLYDKVVIKASAADEMSELVDEANACYINETTLEEKEVPMTLEDGTYQAEFNIDESISTGTWKMSFITLEDASDNVSIVYNSDVHEGLGVDLRAADIRINEDIAAPVLQEVNVTSNSAITLDKVVVKVEALDEMSELAHEANACYINETTLEEKEVPMTLNDGLYEGEFNVVESTASGTWKMSFITLEDTLGNVRVIYNSDVHGGLGRDLSSADIRISEDISGPALEDISISDDEAFINDNVSIKIKASEDVSELEEEANLCYINENTLEEKEISMVLKDGEYKGRISIDEYSDAGTWQISFITLQDNDDNVRIIYNSDVHESLGRDLSDGDIIVRHPIDIEVISDQKEFKRGNDISAAVNVTNNLDNNTKAVVILGVFDENGKLINFVSSENEIEAGMSIELYNRLKPVLSEKYTVKAFVYESETWNSIDFNAFDWNEMNKDKLLSNIIEFKILD